MPDICFVKIHDLSTHPEPHVTPMELAEYWRVSEDSVYRLIDKGALPVKRIGRSIRVATEVAREYERPDGQDTGRG
jgi:excisionase family DNA binding protein